MLTRLLLIKKIMLMVFLFFMGGMNAVRAEERVVILGDSITYAGGWPAYVTEYLKKDKRFKDSLIVNMGVPSETVGGLTEPGHAGGAFPRPCVHDRLSRVLHQFKPTLILACYGMNDGMMPFPEEEKQAAFEQGCTQLKKEADAFGTKIIFITPPLFYPESKNPGHRNIDEGMDRFASWLTGKRKAGWEIIDIRTELRKALDKEWKTSPDFKYAGDGVHPGEAGHKMIAVAVCNGLWSLLKLPKPSFPEGKAWVDAYSRQTELRNEWLGTIQHTRPQVPGFVKRVTVPKAEGARISEWQGFERHDFQIDGRPALVVLPEIRATGSPWIWRTEFFGHEPQADIGLLEKGFAVAYIDMQNMYGSPEAMKVMDRFYDFMTDTYQLSGLVALEGFSRGGLYAFNWAEHQPKRVSSIYADNPVCDYKSWPLGQGKGKGSPDDWKRLLEVYGMTEKEAIKWKGNPVDHLKNMAKARIPILFVLKEQDTVVPVSENANIVESRYRKLGGHVQSIRGPGDHHPHSLPDPAPIVEFIYQAAGRPPKQNFIP